LPNSSLEVLMAWLGVPVTQRHRAVADAKLTAAIFLAIVPHLRGSKKWGARRDVRVCGGYVAHV
jgi:DNA polymerase III epsilon subunit-like protein